MWMQPQVHIPTGAPGSYAMNYLQYFLVIVQFDIAYNCWGQLPCALALMVPPALLYEGGNRLVCVKIQGLYFL